MKNTVLICALVMLNASIMQNALLICIQCTGNVEYIINLCTVHI